MAVFPKVVNRSDTKPIYLIVVETPHCAEPFRYYKTRDINECISYLHIRGYTLTKTQADKLAKDPYANPKTDPIFIDHKVPWNKVTIIENLTYKKPQGENNE
jgi:hypothetical protein